MTARAYENLSSSPISGGPSRHDAARTHSYEKLCQADFLAATYSEIIKDRGIPGELNAGFVYEIQIVEETSRRLASDLKARSYQPRQASRLNPADDQAHESRVTNHLPDLIVQAGLRSILTPLIARQLPFRNQSEDVARWVANAIERGLCRAYAEVIEPYPPVTPPDRLLEWLRSLEVDGEIIGLLGRILEADPGIASGPMLGEVLANIALHGIDQMLEQVVGIGSGANSGAIATVRVEDELIVLTLPDGQHDWVIPAVQHRLRQELTGIGAEADPELTQLVNLAEAKPLRFRSFEFHAISVGPEKLRVRFKQVAKKPNKAGDTGSDKASKAFSLALLSAHGIGRPWIRFKGAARWLWGSALSALDLRKIPGRLVVAWQFLKGHYVAVVASAVVLAGIAFYVQRPLRPPWEKVHARDLPGFFLGQFHSSALGQGEFGLFFPREFKKEPSPYPLIVYLNNWADPQKAILNDPLAGLIRSRLRKGESFPFVVLFARDPDRKWDKGNFDDTLQILEHVIERHAIDQNRIYLMGHRFGGCSVWRLAATHPEQWAALVPIGPFCSPDIERVKKIPCWLFHGTGSRRSSDPGSDPVVQAFRDAGTDIHYSVYPKEQWEVTTDAYESKELFTWLGKKSRP